MTVETGGEETRALIAVGRLRRPVGLKGEMSLEVLTDRRERLQGIERTWVGRTAGATRPHQIQHVRLTRQAVVVKLSEVDSRTEAEGYRDFYVFVDEADSPGPEPGSYYVHEVVGLEVVDEQGRSLGRVTDVQKFPAQDLWIVERDNRQYMIPAVGEFIRSVELDRRRVVVRPIEGLIDES